MLIGVLNMIKFTALHRRQQEKVNAYFQSMSSYWKEVYSSSGVAGKIYQERQAAVLDWIESLGLMPEARVLEIGCGAGFLSVALAQRGLRVQAIDPAEAMVELARRHAVESGTSQLLSVDFGDTYALAFEDACFDLVIAIGVIPWLKRPELAMREMARVTRPDGRIILTADNQAGLINLLEPWYNPALRPLRLFVKGARARLRSRLPSSGVPEVTLHSRRFIDKALASAGLVKTSGKTLGFGPCTFLHRRVLPEALGLALHHRLQRLADQGVPVLHAMGAHYLVLAKKLDSVLLEQSTSATKEAVSASHRRQQEKVNAYFRSMSSYWNEVYSSGGVAGKIYQERQAAVLNWIESLALKPEARVLEIGCGAGFLSVALAQRGLRVQAIDSTEAMVELARRHAVESGTSQLLSVDLGDVCALTFEDGCFDLVVAIGVMMYLKRPKLAIQEMARVTRPGGHIILTAANWAALINLLEPWFNPALRPFMSLVKGALVRFELRPWFPNRALHSRRFIDKALASAGLVKTSSKTLGFGPFTFLHRRVLPEALGLALHHRLQRLADQGALVLRSTGMSYLVLARKPTSSCPQGTPMECPQATYGVLVLDAILRQSLAIVRSLGSRGLRVAAVGTTGKEPTFSSRWCQQAFICPVEEGTDEYLRYLEQVLDRTGACVLITSSDGTIALIRRHRERLEQRAHIALAKEPALAIAINKRQTLEIAKQLGVRIPGAISVRTVGEVEAALREIGLPAVVKPVESWVGDEHHGVRLASQLVTTADEAQRAVEELTRFGGTTLFQQFLSGRRESLTFLYANGEFYARFAQWGKRVNPPLGGASVLGESIALPPDTTDQAERLVREIDLEGVSHIEFRRDSTGVAYLMEINPRLPLSTELAVRSGVDFPYLLYQWASGEKIDRVTSYREGVWLRYLAGDIATTVATLEQRGRPGVSSPAKAIFDFGASFFRPTHYYYVDWKDPLPAWTAAKGFVRGLPRLVRKRLPGRKRL
jgi:2-polyprenyl-3-methyl-5-hydroxy-6-metoxy-1,4-benzoquinol methylase/predicted ATP-grasp superfamily ATP-dependent carboligase